MISVDCAVLGVGNVIVIGAGLAGTEASWQIAQAGVPVRLVEMRLLNGLPLTTAVSSLSLSAAIVLEL